MKKTIKTTFTASLLLVSLLSIVTACGEKEPTSGSATQTTMETSSTSTSSTSSKPTTEHTHTFATEWSSNDMEHWHAATCEHIDEKDALAPHSFDEGVVTSEPGYGIEGVKTFTCTVCEKKKTEVVAALTPFFMPISDVLAVSGKVVVTGTIYSGNVKVGDILTLSNVNKDVTIVGIEKFRKNYESASEGEEVGLLVEGVTRDQIQRGYSLFTPSTKKYFNQIKVNLTALTKDEGGRNTPFYTKYRPQIKLYPYEDSGIAVYAGEVTGCIILPNDLENFMPGETHEVTIILKTKFILDKNMELAVVEGSKKIAYGTITSLEQHAHDENYEEIGVCNVCGFDQCISFNYDSSLEEYSYETHLEVNGRHFFKITPKSDNAETEWKVEIEGTTEENYEVIIYDSTYKNTKDDDHFMLTNSTYYIVVIGKDNVNDITIKVVDTWL